MATIYKAHPVHPVRKGVQLVTLLIVLSVVLGSF